MYIGVFRFLCSVACLCTICLFCYVQILCCNFVLTESFIYVFCHVILYHAACLQTYYVTLVYIFKCIHLVFINLRLKLYSESSLSRSSPFLEPTGTVAMWIKPLVQGNKDISNMVPTGLERVTS